MSGFFGVFPYLVSSATAIGDMNTTTLNEWSGKPIAPPQRLNHHARQGAASELKGVDVL
ncbi:hypothetical protein [Dickeya sp. CFBP 2040]|uniref:hypothetical protein n=1 Tax=Dickeya sp. CFBP 2040 TaxID=2718531 RepID=UPI001445A0E1|nr:hypothetical protein [Dickeya sp. CFBP 2040]